jgi:hypothetical protein
MEIIVKAKRYLRGFFRDLFSDRNKQQGFLSWSDYKEILDKKDKEALKNGKY